MEVQGRVQAEFGGIVVAAHTDDKHVLVTVVAVLGSVVYAMAVVVHGRVHPEEGGIVVAAHKPTEHVLVIVVAVSDGVV